MPNHQAPPTTPQIQAPQVPMAAQGPWVSQCVAGFWRLKHWGFSRQQLLDYIQGCLDLGITSMDHAMVYGSEIPFGEALALAPALRERLQLISKFGTRPTGRGALGAETVNHYDSSPTALQASVEASLRNLRTEYLDLLLVHRPDYLMEPDALAEGFAVLKASGKVRYFGVSNFSVSQFALLNAACGGSLVTHQFQLSPSITTPLDNGLLDQCVALGIKPMLWSCLDGGTLLQPQDARQTRIHNAFVALGQELGVEPETLIYAWLMRLPCRPLPILGSRQLPRLAQAVAACDLTLSREQWYGILQAINGHPVR
jgi:predicted oxidoreductase